MFPSSTKREIRHFHVVVVKRRQRSVQKSCCFANIRVSLHEGGGPQVGEVTCGRLPHLTCKHDHIKMSDYMGRRVTPPKRVTSPTWGPQPPCKQAVNLLGYCRSRCCRDLTIRQRRRQWNRRWKIDFASFQSIRDYPRSPSNLKERIYFGAEERGPHPNSDRDGRNLSPCRSRPQKKKT